MRKILLYCLLGLSGSLFLNACGVLEKKQENLPDTKNGPANIPTQWNARGRIAVINEQDNWHASFVWKQDKDDYTLSFSGPMGQTQLQIEHFEAKEEAGNQNAIIIGQQRYENNTSMQQLLTQHSQVYVPIEALKHWIFGQPEPDSGAIIERDEKGNIRKLQQKGWHISFKKYQATQSLYLPSKMTAEKQTYKIKVFVRSRELLNDK